MNSKINEKDWKLFRKKLPGWQEDCMNRLNKEYMEILSQEGKFPGIRTVRMAVLVPGFLFAQARIWRLAADAACGPRGRAGGKPPPARFCRSMRKHIHRFKGRRVELTGWIWGYVVETGLLLGSRVDRKDVYG